MTDAFPIAFQQPWLLAAAALPVAAAIAAFAWRRPAINRTAAALLAAALALLALAAGGLALRLSAAGEVLVMVDLSASTRTAQYRNSDLLQKRIRQLLGDTPYRVMCFAEDSKLQTLQGQLADLPGNRTVFSPAAAAAILLFSDVRFDLPPAAPPTYVVVDPALQHPADAALVDLTVRDTDIVAFARSDGPQPRRLLISSGDRSAKSTVPPGSLVATLPAPSAPAAAAEARLEPGDPWPENDALSIALPPPALAERWWVGAAPPDPQWRRFDPAQLPAGPAEYLAPAVIVLDNIPASELTAIQQQRLEQYVRDLGGSLIILGGSRAFAAGGYAVSGLESLSPLASTPPNPAMHWIILLDSSGSMASQVGDFTRWMLESRAALDLLAQLPPEDPVTIGCFARDLQWWSIGRPARETRKLPLPPAGVQPNGPTNLEPALQQVTRQVEGALPSQLLILTDAETQLDNPDAIQQGLAGRKISLSVLALADGKALPILQRLSAASGGRTMQQLDPRQWADSVQRLARSAMPQAVFAQPIPARFRGDLSRLGVPAVAPWNRTWLKEGAEALATGEQGGQSVPLAARWPIGSGSVLSTAFATPPVTAEMLAASIARPPRDPRFAVRWEDASQRIAVDVVEAGRYLNGLRLELVLSTEPSDGPVQRLAIPQVGPGRYELALPHLGRPAYATLWLARSPNAHSLLLDRAALAGRYAPEFDRIGNGPDAMERLAHSSGGAVIESTVKTPLNLRWPRRSVSLRAWLAASGALLLAAGLMQWRRSA